MHFSLRTLIQKDIHLHRHSYTQYMHNYLYLCVCHCASTYLLLNIEFQLFCLNFFSFFNFFFIHLPRRQWALNLQQFFFLLSNSFSLDFFLFPLLMQDFFTIFFFRLFFYERINVLEWLHKWMNEWTSEWMNDRMVNTWYEMREWMNEWTYVCMHGFRIGLI